MTKSGNEAKMKKVAQELGRMQAGFLYPELIGPEFAAKNANKAIGLLIRYVLMEQGTYKGP